MMHFSFLLLLFLRECVCEKSIFLVPEKNKTSWTGSTVIFDCKTQQENPFRREWYWNSRLISFVVHKRGSRKGGYVYSGHRNPETLTLRNVTTYDQGHYHCEVKPFISSKQVFKRHFFIEPTLPPQIWDNFPRNMVVQRQRDVKFKCYVSKFYIKEFRWYHGNKLIEQEENSKESKAVHKTRRFRIRRAEFMRIRRVRDKDAGNYTCAVRNKIGWSYAHFKLTVIPPPKRISGPPRLLKDQSETKETTDMVGNSNYLDCTATGKEPINVTWYKNGKLLDVNERALQHGLLPNTYNDKGQILEFKKLHPSDIGVYKCVLENEFGRIEHNITLCALESVRTKPRFLKTQEKHNLYLANVGDTLYVETGEIYAPQSMHVQLAGWFYNESASFKNDSKPFYFDILAVPRMFTKFFERNSRLDGVSNMCTPMPTNTVVNFTFANISRSDFRNYTVIAGNTMGYDVWDFTIQEKPKPTPAPDLKKINLPLIISVAVASVLIVIIVIICCLCYRHRQAEREKRKQRLMHNTLNMHEPLLTPFRQPLPSTQTMRDYLQAHVTPDPLWEVDYSNIKWDVVLGEGAFGQVCKAEVTGLPKFTGSQIVAVKRLKDNATEQEFRDLCSEIEVMKNIGTHRNIINLHGVSSTEELCMIVEFCPYGNLREYLKARRPNLTLPEDEQVNLTHLMSFLFQIAKGMAYLSAQHCIHRDLATRNILVDEQRAVKIADFGLAREVHKDDYYRKTTDGRLPVKWMAIESLFDRVYTSQSDVWSYGIVMWEIVTFGGTPYPGLPLERLFELLKDDGYRMEKPINCSDELYEVMMQCWNERPENRPRFEKLVETMEQFCTDAAENEYLDMQAPLEGLGHMEEMDRSLNISQGDELLTPDDDQRTDLVEKPDMDETSDLGTSVCSVFAPDIPPPGPLKSTTSCGYSRSMIRLKTPSSGSTVTEEGDSRSRSRHVSETAPELPPARARASMCAPMPPSKTNESRSRQVSETAPELPPTRSPDVQSSPSAPPLPPPPLVPRKPRPPAPPPPALPPPPNAPYSHTAQPPALPTSRCPALYPDLEDTTC